MFARYTVAEDGWMDVFVVCSIFVFMLFLLVGDCGRGDDYYCIPGSLFA